MANNNGYKPSIMDTEEGVCVLCGLCTDTARHEVFYGSGTRALSKRYGLWVNLCPRCHAKVHADPFGDRDKTLREMAENAFIRYGHSREEFQRIFITGNVKDWEI
ncbi:MAG: hypothetical protein IJI87_07550 [Mogibacterium sp.]|nr:hypothetical protein [Mogibacterium sp.]